MRKFEIFWDVYGCEQWHWDSYAADEQTLFEMLSADFNFDNYLPHDKDGVFFFTGPYRDLDDVFGLYDKPEDLARLKETLAIGFVCFRRVGEEVE